MKLFWNPEYQHVPKNAPENKEHCGTPQQQTGPHTQDTTTFNNRPDGPVENV
jgi:hypothetical protein